MWQQNLIMVLAAVLCWGLVIAAIMYTYKKQPDKAMLGKIILAYLVGRSSFSLTFTYYPRIQLTHSFLLKGSGALPFPEQWSEIMTNVKKSAAPPANFSFFSEGMPEEFTFWATYDDAFLEGSGSTYVTGEVKSGVSFFMYMDDWQLER